MNINTITKAILAICAAVLIACGAWPTLRDGSYSGTSRSIYTDEPYYGITSVKIEHGRITQVKFEVRDSAKHVPFDGGYEKYFAGNDLYVNQCRNDWKGILSYPDSLLKHQSLEGVDAISGATWSCNLFKASAQIAIEQAKRGK